MSDLETRADYAFFALFNLGTSIMFAVLIGYTGAWIPNAVVSLVMVFGYGRAPR